MIEEKENSAVAVDSEVPQNTTPMHPKTHPNSQLSIEKGLKTQMAIYIRKRACETTAITPS